MVHQSEVPVTATTLCLGEKMALNTWPTRARSASVLILAL